MPPAPPSRAARRPACAACAPPETLFLPGNFTMQSPLLQQVTQQASQSLHVAIIMDGNGRWASRLGLPRTAGHHAGVEAIHRVVEAAPDLGIGALTLFAFSFD